MPIFQASELVIPYGIHPFDICYNNSDIWNYTKILFVITYIYSSLVVFNFIWIKS